MTQVNLSTARQGRLFLIGKLSLLLIGLGFIIRANIAADIERDLLRIVDPIGSGALVGEILGATFLGFAVTLLFGSALVDAIGFRRMLVFSAVSYLVGSIAAIVATVIEPSSLAVWLIYGGFLVTGFGWGAVEAASNPMVAAIYPDDKTHKLNVLHAWWPAGIVIGGVFGFAIGAMEIAWQWNLVILAIPALILLLWCAKGEFPVTERVSSGVTTPEMFLEIFRSPGILVWIFCMMLTAASELGPGQWIDFALSQVVGMQGIFILIYISALMFTMRHFAGPIARRVSPVGLLWFSALLAAIGLYALGHADTPITAFLAATIWGIGVCFMWPTMLATVNERYPRGGAFFLGLMGFAAGMSVLFLLPYLGAIYDAAKLDAAGGAELLAGASSIELVRVESIAASKSFQAVALVPLALLPVFAAIWIRDRLARSKRSAMKGASNVG